MEAGTLTKHVILRAVLYDIIIQIFTIKSRLFINKEAKVNQVAKTFMIPFGKHNHTVYCSIPSWWLVVQTDLTRGTREPQAPPPPWTIGGHRVTWIKNNLFIFSWYTVRKMKTLILELDDIFVYKVLSDYQMPRAWKYSNFKETEGPCHSTWSGSILNVPIKF